MTTAMPRARRTSRTLIRRPCRPGAGASHPLDDRGVGHATALAHRLEAVPAAGPLQLVEQGGHEACTRGPEGMTECDGTTIDVGALPQGGRDRKSTRLNSSHVRISYAVFCLKKKKKKKHKSQPTRPT